MLAAMLLVLSVGVHADSNTYVGEQVIFYTCTHHVDIPGIKYPKSPIQPPYVSLDDHTLYIWSQHNGYTVTLLDDNGTVVCQTYVAAGMQYAVLQSTLSGSFVLQLSDDTYLFTGMIDLD